MGNLRCIQGKYRVTDKRLQIQRMRITDEEIVCNNKGVAGFLAKIVMVKINPSLLAQGSFYAGKEFP